MSCICLCKDTNFKANHNYLRINKKAYTVVYAYAKILILKQITTYVNFTRVLTGCICLCKDTNFKANHNLEFKPNLLRAVVYAYAKILILKQITTAADMFILESMLYMPMQRY